MNTEKTSEDFDGLLVSDTVDDANEQPDDNTVYDDTKADVGSKTLFSQAPRVNKKLILMTLVAVVGLVVIISTVQGRTKKAKNSEVTDAQDIAVPNFGDYQTRGSQPASPVPEQPDPEPQRASLSFFEPQSHAKPLPPPEPARSGSRASSAPPPVQGSPMIPEIEGVWLGQSYAAVKPSSSGSATQGFTPQSPSDYLGERLAALQNIYSAPRGGASPVLAGMGQASTLPPAAAVGQKSPTDSYIDQNMQGNKLAFSASNKNHDIQGSFIAPSTIWNGTIIPAVLITGINTDNPGEIIARVTSNIYDSLSGKELLIPQGCILKASYNSSIAYAQNRVQIAWNTLIRPDGYQVELGNMSGVDARGYTGVRGFVDEHLWEYLKGMLLTTGFAVANGELSLIKKTQNPFVQDLITENQTSMNKLGEKMLERTMNIQPTIIIRSGKKVNVLVNANISLPPLDPYPVSRAYTRN